MNFKKRSTILIIISIVVLITSVFAWFSINKKTPPIIQEAGEVSLIVLPYLRKGVNTYNLEPKKTYGDNDKNKVYALNISNFDNNNHINNLRVDFEITSSVETYFRVRIIDTMTLTYVRADGKTVELTIPRASYDEIPYGIDYDDWYYDETSDWYYYKEKVTAADGFITFIKEGLSYPLWPDDYTIQFGLIIEAVQAKGGPFNNWGLNNPPWDEEGDW